MPIKAKARYRHADHTLWRRVGNGVVIFDTSTNDSFSIEDGAAFVWEKLGAGVPLDEIEALVRREHGASARDARRFVRAFIRGLLKQKLLTPR